LTLTITSINPGPITGTLRLLQEGQEVPLPPDVSTLTLQSGRNILTLRVPLSPGPLHRFEAVFEPSATITGERPSDTASANNRAIAFTTSPGAGRILIVDGTANSAAATLTGTLTAAGLSVATLTPSALDSASDLLSLQAFDLVVLVDVPAEALSAASQQSLARYVTDTGGGLLMVGGPPPTANSFGAGGWKGTPIEPLLPVTLDLPDRLVMPSTAVVIILDSSGSMARGVMGSSASQQQIANHGAAAALGALDKQDLVGVIEFNSTASWVVPLRPNDQPQKTGEAIMGISANGGTNLPPALALAYSALQPARAAVKHIIVLSDGRSQGRGRLAALAKQCKEAPGGPIKISCIAVGDDADTEGMEQLARNAGGEYFRVIDANILPRIFVKAVRVVRTPLVREEPFTPVPGPHSASSPATAGIGELPPLGGLILTQPRLDAQKKNIEGVSYALLTPQGEPVLAHWRAGLGQVGAFTSSPPGSGWAGAWGSAAADSSAAQAMWVQLARSLARGRAGGSGGEAEPDLAVRFEGGGGVLRIRVDVPGAESNAPPPKITVYSPDGTRREVAATLTAPGVYEASAPAGEGGDEGLTIVTVAPTTPGAAPVIGGAVRRSAAADEFRVGGGSDAGTELLTRIARETGGRVLSLDDLRTMTASQLFVRDKVEPRESRAPLWPLLLWAAAGVLMLDIATRRVAWDRWGRVDGSEADGNRKSSSAVRRTAPISTAASPRPESDSPLAAAKRRARKQTDGM
ncbi:MAG: VWA domain-containing protein, partial [Phycisphaerales bacterium]|nr:VWA domain-containing protein [Phycisphaerales bacterium]